MVIPKLYVGSLLYFLFMEPDQYISITLKEIKFNCQPGGLCLNRFPKFKKKSYSVSADHGSFPLTCGLALCLGNWKVCPS